MAIFDLEALKDKAKDLAQTGVSKSKQLGEIAKLNLANVGEEDTIRKATWRLVSFITRSGGWLLSRLMRLFVRRSQLPRWRLRKIKTGLRS